MFIVCGKYFTHCCSHLVLIVFIYFTLTAIVFIDTVQTVGCPSASFGFHKGALSGSGQSVRILTRLNIW